VAGCRRQRGGGGRSTISSGGGTEPLWSRDEQRLFYRYGPELIAVSYAANPGFAVTSRRVLFTGNHELHPFHPNYDVTPDGKRFIMIKPGNEDTPVVVVVNWMEELRHRLGLKRAFNRSPIATTVAVVLTSNLRLLDAPGNVLVARRESGLPKDAVANVAQVITLNRDVFSQRAGSLSAHTMRALDDGLMLVMDL